MSKPRTMEQCMKHCSEFACKISTTCYSKSKYNFSVLDAFTGVTLALLIAEIVVLGFFVKLRKHENIKEQIRIAAVFVVALLLRGLWWQTQKYRFHSDLELKVTQSATSLSMLLTILGQSFYIETWFRVILVFRHMRGEKTTKIVFLVINLVISIMDVVAIIIRCVQPPPQENQPAKGEGVYRVFINITALLSLLLALAFMIIGTLILYKLKKFYNFCSRTVLQFLFVSIALTLSSLSRAVGLAYKDLTGQKIKNQNLFGALSYFIPDTTIVVTIGVMHVLIVYNALRLKKSTRQESIDDDAPADPVYV